MKMHVFLHNTVVKHGVVAQHRDNTDGLTENVFLSCSYLLCLAYSINILKSDGITLGNVILLLSGLWCLPLFQEVFPLEFSVWCSLQCGITVALLCHLLSLFLPLIFICPWLSCPSLNQKQNILCGCKLSMPNSLNNCSTPRVNVKHKSDSKFLLMPSYNNKNSRFNNWGSRMVDLVVWCNH